MMIERMRRQKKLPGLNEHLSVKCNGNALRSLRQCGNGREDFALGTHKQFRRG